MDVYGVEEEKRVSGILESFPTYRLHRKPRPGSAGMLVFSRKDERYDNNSYSSDAGTRMMIYDQIISAFSNMGNRYDSIVQFWAPVTIGGKRLLSTSGQPFAVSVFGSSFEKYRRLSVEHVYDIDVNSKFRGTPAYAFLNHFPEIASIHKVDPLLRYTLEESSWTNSFMMPIRCPSQTSSSSDCIGVIECSSWLFNRGHLFNEMNTKIKEVGLSLYNVQDRIPYMTINGLKLAREEIQVALKSICESHNIGVAQVWISCEDENHVPFSFSSEDTQSTRRLALNLTGYCVDMYSMAFNWCFGTYYDACGMVPLITGEELVEKTLQDNQPRFCENIAQLGTDTLMAWVSIEDVECSGFTICMNIDSGDFSCAFEFIWYHDPDYVLLIEALLLTLKRHLPRFNFASAHAEPGDQLFVIDVDNSTKSETKFFQIFKEKGLSTIPEEMNKGKKAMAVNYNALFREKSKKTQIELSREDIEQHYANTMKNAAGELGERLSRIPEALKEGKQQVALDYIAPQDTNCKAALVPIPQQVKEQYGTSTTENFLENIFGNANPMADRDDERLTDFLETLPIYILHKKPETEGALWVFHSEDEGSQNISSLDDLGTRIIYEKIKSAFSKVNNSGELIVQFWAPVTSSKGRVLSTSGRPFAVSDFVEGLTEYRGRCMGYVCDIDMRNNNKVVKDEIEHGDHHPMTLISGPPTYAFLNHLPEAVLDTKNHREGSLMRYASDCGLWTSYTLPIGCPSEYHSSCIGVVECSSMSSINLEIVTTMNRALEQEGLNVFNVQDHIAFNTINGLTLVRDEIQVALNSVCGSHNIGVAQVWISYVDENHVPFSFSSEDTQTTRMLALKLTGYHSVNEDFTACHWHFKEYCDVCDLVPLKMGEELVEKTLQDYQPRFCENISQLGTDMLMGWVSTDDVECSAFTICMSTGTVDFNCAFEFIWQHNPDYVLLLEALLLTLKMHLPRFKFASGAELGDQLHIIDVLNSTETDAKVFEIFTKKRLSPIPEAMNKGKKAMVNYNALLKEKRDTTQIELSREDIEQHYGKTMKQAAEELGVSLSTLKRKHNKLGMSGWQGPDLAQRKAYNSSKNQINKSHTEEKDNGVIHDPSPVKRNDNTVIKAEYADDIIKLHLGISELTFVTVENEIGKKFKLKHGTFKIKYLDEDEEWILMTSDQDLIDCVQNSRSVSQFVVRLRVLLHNQ